VVGLGGSAVPGRGRQSKDGVYVVLDSLSMQVAATFNRRHVDPFSFLKHTYVRMTSLK
jgi:hypothetical protein